MKPFNEPRRDIKTDYRDKLRVIVEDLHKGRLTQAEFDEALAKLNEWKNETEKKFNVQKETK